MKDEIRKLIDEIVPGMNIKKTKINIAVAIMVLNHEQDKFLVSMRLPACLTGSSQYAFPGGMIDFGETVFDAAIREVAEETGLIVEINDRSTLIREFIDVNHHHITFIISALIVGGELMNLEPDKHTDWEWWGLEELNKLSVEQTWLPVNFIKNELLNVS